MTKRMKCIQMELVSYSYRLLSLHTRFSAPKYVILQLLVGFVFHRFFPIGGLW